MVSGGTAADEVRYERRGAAAVLTLDRAERRNAIDGPTAEALLAGFRRFEADEGARVLVVTGAGGVFCAGADLTALDTLEPRLEAPEGPLGFTRLTASKPTIAAVEGWAVAGGFELALWCDVRVASETARFGFFERRWGVPLIDGGTQRLPLVIGQGRALELILTGREVGAVEARQIGLVGEVEPAGLALDRALVLAEALARFPQETMLADRRATLEGAGLPLPEGLALEAAMSTGNHAAGVEGARRFAAGEGRGGHGTSV